MTKKSKSKQNHVSVSVPTPEDVSKLTFASQEEREKTIIWEPQAGPQTIALLREEFEIFVGGSKGGGKSYLGIGWLISGNPSVPIDKCTPIDISYINCPDYRALAIRANLIDLESWREEAMAVYGKMGAEFKHNPDEIVFPSGAKIILGHLDNSDAVYKYFGQVVHRVFLDELTFVPDFKIYQKLMSCLRSAIKGIRPQMLLTGNPGGPGHSWVQSRFITPVDEKGNRIPPLTPIVDKSFNPFLKRYVEISRIYIPARIGDNKKLVQMDPMYYSRLMGMDEAERKAYIDGDWDAFLGTYFTSFRGIHKEGEPDNACHVVSLKDKNALHYRELQAWWPRWIGVDWGYKHCSSALWGCQDPNGQAIIYRELIGSEISAFELGMSIALATMDDFKGLERKNILLFLSPDAFSKRDETNTIAELITSGIQRVLGPATTYILKADEENGNRGGSISIGVTPAQNARIIGWQHMRELMRWKQTTVSGAGFTMKDEILPRLLISDECKRLIQAIPSATYAKDGEDVLKTTAADDDILDSCFVAGTMIETADGPLPIEDVRVGCEVLTRKGLRKVVAAGMTNPAAKTVSVDFSDGVCITCTDSHPIYVHGRGFIPIGGLKCGDRVLTLKQLPIKELFLGDTQKTKRDISEFTSGRLETTGCLELALFIEKFGKTPMEKFQKALTSITSMATRSITRWRICNASLLKSISASILPMNGESLCAEPLMSTGHSLRSGMPRQMAECGTRSTQMRLPLLGCLGNLYAKIAASLTSYWHTYQNSAQIIASRRQEGKRGWISKIAHALVVALRSSATSISKQNTIPVLALNKRASETLPVFNLTVEGEHEYFANGILVHNCRYLLAAHKYNQNKEPFQVFYTRRMETAQQRHPEGMDAMMVDMVQRKIEEDFKVKDVQPMTVHRASSRQAKFDRQAWASQRGLHYER